MTRQKEVDTSIWHKLVADYIMHTPPRVNHWPPHFTEKETEPWRG